MALAMVALMLVCLLNNNVPKKASRKGELVRGNKLLRHVARRDSPTSSDGFTIESSGCSHALSVLQEARSTTTNNATTNPIRPWTSVAEAELLDKAEMVEELDMGLVMSVV